MLTSALIQYLCAVPACKRERRWWGTCSSAYCRSGTVIDLTGGTIGYVGLSLQMCQGSASVTSALASPTPSRIRNSVFSITGRCTFYPVSSKLSTIVSQMSFESGTILSNHLNQSAIQTGTRYLCGQWMGKEGTQSPFPNYSLSLQMSQRGVAARCIALYSGDLVKMSCVHLDAALQLACCSYCWGHITHHAGILTFRFSWLRG